MTPEDHYVVIGAKPDTTWKEAPLSDGTTIDHPGVGSGQIALPSCDPLDPYVFLAGIPSGYGYGNLITYSTGTYPSTEYFRARFLDQGFAYSTLCTLSGSTIISESTRTYYSVPSQQIGLGRLLYFYVINNGGFTGSSANCYLWVNNQDNDDWILRGDTSSAQVQISGFRIVNPQDLFWSAEATSAVKGVWDNFMDSTTDNSFRTSRTKAGILCMSGETYDAFSPYYFIHCGTIPGGVSTTFSTSSAYWMFYKWLEALYSILPAMGFEFYVSFEDSIGCVDFHIVELFASTKRDVVKVFKCASQLNGNNGEVTNTDDMPPKKQKTTQKPPKKKGGGKKKGNKKPVLQQGLVVQKAPAQKIPHTVKMSRCCRTFLKAAVDPFNCTGMDVFLPVGQAIGSQRVQAFMRVLVTIGTAGVGFIGVVPTVSSGSNCIWYTNASYAGTTFVPYTDVASPILSTGVVASTLSNLPYGQSVIWPSDAGESYGTAPLNCNCVAWGLSVMNASAEVNLGGTITAYSDPTRTSLYGASQADISTFAAAQVVLGSRQRVYLTMYPLEENEFEFSPDARNQSGGTVNIMYPQTVTLGTPACTSTAVPAISNLIMFTGIPGSQYLCHIVAFNEYYGKQTQTVNKNKVSDPQGMAKVVDILGRARTYCQEQGRSLATAVVRSEQLIARELHEY